tara:strand:- start:123 stop:632 length:510 start_codon:yes stop_codon:yes gene_type:complete
LIIPISSLKNILINRFGENKYKILYSLIALVGYLIIIYGFARADFKPESDPLTYSIEIELTLMSISMVLIAAVNIQTNIKKLIKHPMLIAIFICFFVHLIANGDLQFTMLFSSFGIYALIDIIFSKKVLIINYTEKFTLIKNVIVVIIGFVGYTITVHFHHYISGVKIF